MKKIINTTAIVAILLLMGSFAANATTPGSIQKNTKESARQEIMNGITCPSFITANDATNQVKAIVQVDEHGKVKVEEINSANPQLKAYVIDQLQNMKLKSPGQSQRFVLVINFQVG